MSAEGKKKRGESGQSNAKAIPFRGGGHGAHAPQKMTIGVPPRRYNSETAVGLIGGVLAGKLGFKMPNLSLRLATWFEDELDKECPKAASVLASA